MFRNKLEYDGTYSKSGKDLSSDEKLEREALLSEKPEYILKINSAFISIWSHMTSMMMYSIGIANFFTMFKYEEFSNTAAISVDNWRKVNAWKENFQDYWKTENCRDYEDFLQKKQESDKPDKYTEFYREMLHSTWQNFRSYECMTFYNNRLEEDNTCSIIVQLKSKDFAETEVGKRFLKRIKEFCMKKKISLLSISLCDKNGKIVREFLADESEKSEKTDI